MSGHRDFILAVVDVPSHCGQIVVRILFLMFVSINSL